MVIPQSSEEEKGPGWYYDVARTRLVVRTPKFSTSRPVEVVFVGDFGAENRRLAYLLREVVSRLVSAAILLLQSKGPPELVERIREIEKLAEKTAISTCCAPVIRENLQAGLALIRNEITGLVRSANETIRNDEIKMQFMKTIVGVSITSRLIPSPFRQVTVRSELRFQPYGWGEINGTIEVENHPAQPITLVRPGGDLFFEAPVGLDTIQLRKQAFIVRTNINWNDIALQLVVEKTLDNTFIKQFYAVGPFGDGSYRRMMEISFAPERQIILAGSYVGKKRQAVVWKKLPWKAPVADFEGQDYRMVDLSVSLKRIPPAAAYAIAHVFVPKNTPADLLVGSQGGIVLWVNGVEVFRETYMRYGRPDQASVGIQLRRGWNLLRVKAVDEGNVWGFYLRLLGRDGNPVPGAISGWGQGFE